MHDPSGDDVEKVIAQVSLSGRTAGLVRSLRGFRKGPHSVPDAVNAATQRFLAQLCAEELAAEAENLFQRTRAALGYKRTQLTLEVSSPSATLVAKDFTLELAYTLQPADPASYHLTRTLHNLRSGELIQTTEFNTLLAGLFDTLVFTLARSVSVEAVIDAVEALPDRPTTVHDPAVTPSVERTAPAATDRPRLTVDYPADCHDCVLRVPGVAAVVRCDGASLAMELPRAVDPRVLLETFAATRTAFRLSADPLLAKLL